MFFFVILLPTCRKYRDKLVVHLKLEGKKGNMYGHELERNRPKIWGKKAHDWAYWWFMVRVWLWLRVDLWELHDHRRWHDPKAIKLRPWELIPNSIETHIGGMRKFRLVIWFWIIFFHDLTFGVELDPRTIWHGIRASSIPICGLPMLRASHIKLSTLRISIPRHETGC